MKSLTQSYQSASWVQRLGLLVAGGVSFGAAAYWNISSADTADLVEPVVRADRTATPSNNQPPSNTPKDLPSQAQVVDAPLELSGPSQAPQKTVARNPFGELNLQADAPAQTQSKQAPKPLPPPPPVVQEAAPPPPPPPMAPVLPFTVVGSIKGQGIAEGNPVAFLKFREEILIVKPGTEIDGTYRVLSVTPSQVEFLYLPLQQKQSLSPR